MVFDTRSQIPKDLRCMDHRVHAGKQMLGRLCIAAARAGAAAAESNIPIPIGVRTFEKHMQVPVAAYSAT